jgi:membrane-bound serine protease (ClpP class)
LVGLPAETESGSRVGHEIPEDLRTKIINDTAVYAHSIAEARDRNADWAEDAVRDGVSVGAEEAVELDVVDLVAADRTELLARIDGMTVRLPDGEVTLGAAGALVVEEPMSPFEEFLMVLSDPNIALILLSLGTLGIYFELSSPGAFFPGIFGAIALILALFSLGTLPINYAGLALLLFGLALLGAEIWVASGGVLGIGGGIAFVLGALILVDDSRAPFLEISRPLIFGITLALVAFVLFALQAVMRPRRRPAYIGGDMIGREGIARGASSVFVEGELWQARPANVGTTLSPGDPVRIIRRDHQRSAKRSRRGINRFGRLSRSKRAADAGSGDFGSLSAEAEIAPEQDGEGAEEGEDAERSDHTREWQLGQIAGVRLNEEVEERKHADAQQGGPQRPIPSVERLARQEAHRQQAKGDRLQASHGDDRQRGLDHQATEPGERRWIAPHHAQGGPGTDRHEKGPRGADRRLSPLLRSARLAGEHDSEQEAVEVARLQVGNP